VQAALFPEDLEDAMMVHMRERWVERSETHQAYLNIITFRTFASLTVFVISL
jgi:hypothetical protein